MRLDIELLLRLSKLPDQEPSHKLPIICEIVNKDIDSISWNVIPDQVQHMADLRWPRASESTNIPLEDPDRASKCHNVILGRLISSEESLLQRLAPARLSIQHDPCFGVSGLSFRAIPPPRKNIPKDIIIPIKIVIIGIVKLRGEDSSSPRLIVFISHRSSLLTE